MPDGITLADVNAGLGPALALLSALENPKTKTAMLKEVADALEKLRKERAGYTEEMKGYRAYLKAKPAHDAAVEQLAVERATHKTAVETYKTAADTLTAAQAAFEVVVRDDERALQARESAVKTKETSLKRRDTQVSNREKAVAARLKQLADAGIKIPDLPAG